MDPEASSSDHSQGKIDQCNRVHIFASAEYRNLTPSERAWALRATGHYSTNSIAKIVKIPKSTLYEMFKHPEGTIPQQSGVAKVPQVLLNQAVDMVHQGQAAGKCVKASDVTEMV